VRLIAVWRTLFANPAVVVGAAGALLIVLAVIWGLVGPPSNPVAFDPEARFQAPSVAHLMGTDEFGRDIFSRVIAGAPLSIATGLGAMALAALIGVPLGLLAGYRRGAADLALLGVIDLLLAFPAVLLALLLLTVLGSGGITGVIIAVGISSIPLFARLTRSSVLALQSQPFVEAAVVLGSSDRGVVLDHILPNIRGPLIVLATLVASGAILIGSSLAFVGLGPPPPSPEWGAMLADARNYLQLGWWLSLFPGAAIALAVLSFNLLGDGLGRVLDPIYR
jgi:ABC-type dipeptide/oligopeptide/nickel transport system permease subunit